MNKYKVYNKTKKELAKGGWIADANSFKTVFNAGLRLYPIFLLLGTGKKVKCYYDTLDKCYCNFGFFGARAMRKSAPVAFKLRINK